MAYRDWYITQFHETLGEPLRESDGIPRAQLDKLLDGQRIPLALYEYYCVAGRHWLNTNHNELRSPDALESVDSHTIFMDENQVVVQWAIRDSELQEDDPLVYLGQLENDRLIWYAEDDTLSRFIIATWRWTLTGEE